MNTARLRRRALPYAFVSPLVVLLTLINFYPVMYSLYLSLCTWPIERFRLGPTFAGLVNYARMAGDQRLWTSVNFMVFYVVLAISMELVVGMGVALLLDSRMLLRAAIRSAVVLPRAMSPLVVGLTWRYLFNYDYGVVTYITKLAGLSPVAWLSTRVPARLAIVLVEVWQNMPFVALVLLAGLQAIPDEYAEAARVDGASPWQVFWRVTLPLLRPAILVALVLRVTNAIRMFDISYGLTGGGPYASTETFSYLAYVQGFESYNIPYAAAISVVILLLNLVVTIAFIRVLYVKVEV